MRNKFYKVYQEILLERGTIELDSETIIERTEEVLKDKWSEYLRTGEIIGAVNFVRAKISDLGKDKITKEDFDWILDRLYGVMRGKRTVLGWSKNNHEEFKKDILKAVFN